MLLAFGTLLMIIREFLFQYIWGVIEQIVYGVYVSIRSLLTGVADGFTSVIDVVNSITGVLNDIKHFIEDVLSANLGIDIDGITNAISQTIENAIGSYDPVKRFFVEFESTCRLFDNGEYVVQYVIQRILSPTPCAWARSHWNQPVIHGIITTLFGWTYTGSDAPFPMNPDENCPPFSFPDMYAFPCVIISIGPLMRNVLFWVLIGGIILTSTNFQYSVYYMGRIIATGVKNTIKTITGLSTLVINQE